MVGMLTSQPDGARHVPLGLPDEQLPLAVHGLGGLHSHPSGAPALAVPWCNAREAAGKGSFLGQLMTAMARSMELPWFFSSKG